MRLIVTKFDANPTLKESFVCYSRHVVISRGSILDHRKFVMILTSSYLLSDR